VKAPDAIREAAEERAAARVARDWATADRLRGEIEAAGWRVIDRGTSYRLEPAHPPEEEVGGEIRYGRSDAVPSRLDEPATGFVSVVLVVDADDPQAVDATTATARHMPEDADLIVVGDGIGDTLATGIGEALDASRVTADHREAIRTSAPLGRAAALNAGIRRARGPVVVALDTSVEPTGDIVTPLALALEDPLVAVAGPFGLASADLRRFDEVVASGAAPTEVAAIQGYAMAFRRADAITRGPLDEGFRFYRNLDIWWSLVLRDEGEGYPPRRAIAVPDLPLQRREPWAWTSTSAAARDRLSKRNFYRVLDRFRARHDLARSAPTRNS
jgi:cysteinyl-tRNA synthetase